MRSVTKKISISRREKLLYIVGQDIKTILYKLNKSRTLCAQLDTMWQMYLIS